MIKVLYLLPEVPVPVTSGGKAVFKSHVERLATDKDIELTLIAVDVDGNRAEGLDWLKAHARKAVLLPRSIPLISSGAGATFASVLSYVRSSLPRAVAVRAGAAVQAQVRAEWTSADVVVADHISAMGMLPPDLLDADGPPILLIEHNAEACLLAQRAADTGGANPKALVFRIDESRMRRFEAAAVKRAAQVACISCDDLSGVEAMGPRKPVAEIPFVLEPASVPWSFNGSKRLLFVGPFGYFTNRDAIRWLCTQLAPHLLALDRDIRIDLIGTRANELPASWVAAAGPLLSCHGNTSREDLVALHYGCDLFLCPLEFGSGIKIKVLEALSFGVPVLSTAEGLKGLRFVAPASRFEREQAGLVAQRIAKYLTSRQAAEELAAMNWTAYAAHWTAAQGALRNLVYAVAGGGLSAPVNTVSLK